MIRRASAVRAGMLGLRIVSGTSSRMSKRSAVNRAATSSGPALPFLLPSNTPVLVRLLEHLRTMKLEEIALVEIVAIAIAKGQL